MHVQQHRQPFPLIARPQHGVPLSHCGGRTRPWIRSTARILFFLSALLVAGTPQAALLEGKDIQISLLFPDLTSVLLQQTVRVGPGTEFSNALRSERIDISDTRIVFANSRSAGNVAAAFNGFWFFDVTDTIVPFGNVTISPQTNLAGFDASDVTFDGDSIFVNFAGTSVTADTIVILDIAAARLPEPATLALLAPLLLVLSRRRRPTRTE